MLERHVANALAHGKRVVVLAESIDDPDISAVLARTGRGDRDGQVQVRADNDRMLALLEADKRAALADGFAGVHFVTDMSWAARHPESIERLPDYERAAGALFADGRASAICQYDRTRFPADAVAACAAAHSHLVSAFEVTLTLDDPRLRIEVGHGTLRAQGEIDMANVHLLEKALATAVRGTDDLCVDASDLTFIDVRGVNALFDAARAGRVALLAPRSPLRGMLDVLDAPDQLPGLDAGY